MITLSIDESNKHVLRVSASYLLALAGDISAEITPVFNAAELAEETALTPKPAPPVAASVSAGYAPAMAGGAQYVAPSALPSAASVFGGEAPKPVLASAVAEALPTAPEVTAAPTLTPPPSALPPPVPTPEVAESVPSAPAAPLGYVPAVELDADGLPWDARIHSEARSKVVAGTWKYKRGVDPQLVETVEAELRAVMGTPAPKPPVPPVTETAPSAGDGATAHTMTAPAPTAPDPTLFPRLIQKISAAVSAGQVTQAAVIEVVKECGGVSLPALLSRPDLIPTVSAKLDELIAGGAQ